MRLLDNVLTHFITSRPTAWRRAKYAALRERSVGLGVMGFHSFLQAQRIPFESATGEIVEHEDVPQNPREPPTQRRLRSRRNAAPARTRRNAASRRASATSSRSRRPPRSASSAAAHQRLHRADPGQYLHAQDTVGRVLGAQSASAKLLAAKGADTRTSGNRSSSMKARCSISMC